MTQKKAPDKLPGRPATIRGRATVVSLIITPDACGKLGAAALAADTSEGDVFEAIVLKHATKVKIPAVAVDGWKAKTFGGRAQRFEGRTARKNVRMSPDAIVTIDAVASRTQAVRSDVAEALIQQFAHMHTKKKG